MFARPLPTVLQCSPQDDSKPASESHISDSSGHDGSSNQHTDSSYSSSQSRSSHHLPNISLVPLPKGAQAPSSPSSPLSRPHLTVITHQGPEVCCTSPSSNREPQSSIWRVRWRDVSKVIKWALPLSKQKHKKHKAAGPVIAVEANQDSGVYVVGRFGEPSLPLDAHCSNLNMIRDPTSPSSAPSSVDLHHGRQRLPTSQSDFCHQPYALLVQDAMGFALSNPTEFEASQVDSIGLTAGTAASTFQSDLLQRNCTSGTLPFSKAFSDLGHSNFEESSAEGREMFIDIDPQRSVDIASDSHLQQRLIRPYSDVGHDLARRDLSSSTCSLNISQKPSRRDSVFLRTTVSRARTISTTVDRRHSSFGTATPPRKLRKNRPAALDASQPPSSFKFNENIRHPSTVHPSSAPATPSRPSPRKLTKRPTPSTSSPAPASWSSPSFETTQPLESHQMSKYSDFGPNPESIRKLPIVPLYLNPEPITGSAANLTRANARLQRPSFLRSESNRRWTVAEGEVPDELFVAELERLRHMGMRAGEVHVGGRASVYGSENALEHTDRACERSESLQQDDAEEPWQAHSSSAEIGDDAEWLNARRVLMCCHELVRTERSYAAHLQQLADGDTSQPVPPLLCSYLPALISASETLSSYFHEDPSTWGVSAAFLAAEEELEAALVAWCGIVGEFFGGGRGAEGAGTKIMNSMPSIADILGSHRSVQSHGYGRPLSLRGHGSPQSSAHADYSTASRRTVSLWRKPLSLSHLPLEAGIEEGKDTHRHRRMSIKTSKPAKDKERKRKQHVRDLAIQPTQRVTRYVLLFKDLLKHTPTSSPAHAIVKDAADSAMRIAQKCDRAQGNAAFLRRS